jgi:hypothetical protein
VKRFQFFQYAAAAVASFGFVLPSSVWAADASQSPVQASPEETPTILDVSLGEGGILSGQVLNADGGPMARAIVTVRSSGSDVASAVTDRQGYFAFHGLQGGVYEVNSAGSSGVFRLWTADASPPLANKDVLIVADGPVNRGQCCSKRCSPPGRCYSGPRTAGPITNGQVVLATLVVAGIAGGIVAVAVSHEQKSGS